MKNKHNDFYKDNLVPLGFRPDWLHWGSKSKATAIDLAELTIGIEPGILFSTKKTQKLKKLEIILEYENLRGNYSNIDNLKLRVTNLNNKIIRDISDNKLKGKKPTFKRKGFKKHNLFEINVSDFATYLKEMRIDTSDELKSYFKPNLIPKVQSENKTKDNILYNRQVMAALLESLMEVKEYKYMTQEKLIEKLAKKFKYISVGKSSIEKIFGAANNEKN